MNINSALDYLLEAVAGLDYNLGFIQNLTGVKQAIIKTLNFKPFKLKNLFNL